MKQIFLQNIIQNNSYEQQQSKQTSQLFPQYQYKKNLYSPQKGGQNTEANGLSGNPNTLLSFNLQPTPVSSIGLGINDVKTPTTNSSNSISQGGIPISTIGIGQLPSTFSQSTSQQMILKNNISSPYSQQRIEEVNLSNDIEQKQFGQQQNFSLKSTTPLGQKEGVNAFSSNPLGLQQINLGSNLSGGASNNINIGTVNLVNQINKSPTSSSQVLGNSSLAGNSSFFSNLASQPNQFSLQQQKQLQRTSIESHQMGSILAGAYKPQPSYIPNTQTSQQQPPFQSYVQSQQQSSTNIQGASINNNSSNSQSINEVKQSTVGVSGQGFGLISMDSSYSGIPSNTFLGQSQGPQIIPSNDNLSAIALQDTSNMTNMNYFNFQDLTITSQHSTQAKVTNANSPNPTILDNPQLNNNFKLTQQSKLQGNNIPQSYSPLPSSIANKADTQPQSKLTSVTANNTPYKSSNYSNSYKSDAKPQVAQPPTFDTAPRSNLQTAQSPGRIGQIPKNGNNYTGMQLNQSEQINKNFQNRHSQHQKSYTGTTTSQTALNIIGNSPQGQQLLPSQQQLVQSIVLQRNRSQSPNNLKSSKNYGQVSPLINKNLSGQQNVFQYGNVTQSVTPNVAQHLLSPNYTNNQYNSTNGSNNNSNTAKNSRTMLSQSPENRITSQVGSSGSTSANISNVVGPQQSQQNQVPQSSYYKVASQIRRNQLKERAPSALNSENTNSTGLLLSNKGGSVGGNNLNSQLNINSSVNVGVADISQQQLIYSQNYGKALPMNEQQRQQYLQQQKETIQKSSAGIKRQNSSGSQGSKSQDIKDSRKRFTVVDKFNEKYTKKLIIDLCNYMNQSNDGGDGDKQKEGGDIPSNIGADEEDPVKRTNAFNKDRKGNWQNNSNMNMLDILSQQRVLQRSVSSQKRNILSHNNNNNNNNNSSGGVGGIAPFGNNINTSTKHINLTTNPMNHHLHTPSKSASSSANKRFSFRYNDKPWENSSFQNNSKFNSKYGSFSVMRSMNNSQSNWNLNGSQNINSSINGEGQSTLTNIKTNSKIQSNTQINLDGKGIIRGTKKRMSNNFILEGFNDSQEINSSRNQNAINSNRIKTKATNLAENRNILTKNITADLSVPHPNPNSKYKFQSSSNTHLSKPASSSNAFQKQQQLNQQNKYNRGSAHIDPQNSKVKNSPQINPLKQEKQSISPLPTSQTNSKNSTKSEIKKSQIISGPSSQTNKNRFSDNNYSQHESFEKEQEGEYNERELEVEDEEYDEDRHCEDFENEEEEDEEDEDLEVQNQTDGSSSSNKAFPGQTTHLQQPFAHDQGLHQISHQARLNNNGEGLRPSTMIPVQMYNFESNLEHIPGLNINIEELRKERAKLIRKITSTFKVKNKALSTSQEYYKVLHVIGKGAFAKVCLAIQLLTGKFVAIKLIDKQILRSESAKKRVLQEVQILRKLNNHKHVLKLLEVFENRKLIFIVTEYFRGQDLMKMMKERNGEPYSENQVRHMLAQVLSGLRYIHGNMVLHRDIKLDNLLVDASLNLKVIDFGISRIIQKDQKMMEQCGTPAFLAPEIIANKGYEGFGSDMWSLGVLIYILLFGKVPFKGNNLTELHRNILNGVLPIEEMRDTNVSFEAQDLIAKILKLKVKERINLEGIINSPWMRGYVIPDGIENRELQQKQMLSDSNSDSHGNIGTTEQFDEKIIGYIEGFGYSREYILRCLNKGGVSHVNAIYKVIKNSPPNNSTQGYYS